jgi:hypothetical protein
MKILFCLLALSSAFWVGWLFHGVTKPHQNNAITAPKKISLSRSAIEIDKLEDRYRNGKFFSNKADFIRLFSSYPVFKHPDSGQPFPCPFEDRVKCENYTVTLANESWERGSSTFGKNEFIYAGKNLDLFRPKPTKPEDDVATGIFQTQLTAGFDRKSGLCQWWYFWFSM